MELTELFTNISSGDEAWLQIASRLAPLSTAARERPEILRIESEVMRRFDAIQARRPWSRGKWVAEVCHPAAQGRPVAGPS